MHVYINIYIYIYIYVCICIYIYICVYTFICVPACVCVGACTDSVLKSRTDPMLRVAGLSQKRDDAGQVM